MPPLPSPVRAVLGLAATILDEAKTLPDKAIELPMLAVSKTLQFSLRAQRRYAALAARGDELLSGRQTTDDAPDWAVFDEPVFDEPVTDEPVTDEPVADAPSPRPRKTVRAPRTGTPSAFDTVADE
jgi:hypothetical protein